MSDLHLYVYDLSKGMAKQFSAMFLGKHFDGVWHTGVVAFGKEWFFGNDGIDCCPPEGTILGKPNEKIKLGYTELTESDFAEVINQLSASTFKRGSYNLLEHNCNNFSNELSVLLVGKPIPQHILDLPREILNTSLGPMLRPLLEQAADPIHQFKSGHTPIFAPKTAQETRAATSGQQQSASVTKQSPPAAKLPIPSAVVLFKPSLAVEFDPLLEHCQSNNLLKINEYNLLVETKEYLQQVEITWSINKNHIKTLFVMYLEHLKDDETNRLRVLRILQLVALNADVALLLAQSGYLTDEFLTKISSNASPLNHFHSHSLQLLSNTCAHHPVSQLLLEKHQDVFFKHLSDYALVGTSDGDEISRLVHESAISFFFNMLSAYHLESLLKESNALTLGCALLERLPLMKSKPKTIYHMLSLLRSCLSKSQDMRDVALSMDFDLSKYAPKNGELETTGGSGDDTYANVVHKIDTLIHPTSNGLDANDKA